MAVTTLDPKTALIVIDLQNGIVALLTVHPAGEVVKYASALADAFPSAWLAGRARSCRWCAIGPDGTGSQCCPASRRLELMRSPAHREILEEHFGCRVHFRAANNDLIFRKSDLDRPFVTHNAELLAMLAPQLEAELADQRLRQTVQDQVKQTLKRLLAGQRPTIQEVSQELNLSARTLQRRLTEAGVTFQQVLEEARRELARHYLLQSSLELNETAYLLGYESANSFFRAFHHWEGTSPGQWRAVQRRANGKPPLVSQVPQIY